MWQINYTSDGQHNNVSDIRSVLGLVRKEIQSLFSWLSIHLTARAGYLNSGRLFWSSCERGEVVINWHKVYADHERY